MQGLKPQDLKQQAHGVRVVVGQPQLPMGGAAGVPSANRPYKMASHDGEKVASRINHRQSRRVWFTYALCCAPTRTMWLWSDATEAPISAVETGWDRRGKGHPILTCAGARAVAPAIMESGSIERRGDKQHDGIVEFIASYSGQLQPVCGSSIQPPANARAPTANGEPWFQQRRQAKGTAASGISADFYFPSRFPPLLKRTTGR